MKEASLYKKLPGKKVRCGVCQRGCVILPDSSGFCQTRINKNGKLYTAIYGLVSCANNDPIEKKPVFHFKPGSLCFSLGTYGCNFRCKFCQNYDISFTDSSEVSLLISTSSSTPPTSHFSSKTENYLSPEDTVKTAINLKSQGIAFTYNEPAIWLEYSLDCAKLAKGNLHLPGGGVPALDAGRHLEGEELYTCWVTNGYATKETIDLIAPYLDIYRVDLKSFDDSFYQKLIAVPKAAGVFEVTKYVHDKYPKIHLECVTNIIPGWNDSEDNLKKIADWIVKNLGPLTPWHVTRYCPVTYNSLLPDYPTPTETLSKARQIGQKAGLAFVYPGNIETKTGENTYCPKCQTLNIKRNNYQTEVLAVKKKGGCGYCQKCQQDLNLII